MPKSYLNREQRIILIKFIALLSMIKWYNILLIIIAQYLASFFFLNPGISKLEILLDHKIHLITLSTAFIIAAGFIINSFYDLERDLINRPNTTVFDRVISRFFALNCFMLFNVVGVSLAFIVSYKVFLFQLIFALSLWLYSHKLHKLPFFAEFSASLLSVSAFFSICIYYNEFDKVIFAYGSYIFALNLAREFIKNIEAMKGDIIHNYKTTPVHLGLAKTKLIIFVILLVSLGLGAYMIYYFNDQYIKFYFLTSLVLSICSFIILLRASEDKSFQIANNILKTNLLLGIISITFVHINIL